MHQFLKLFSLVVLLLMVVGVFYAGYISLKYWAGIGV